MPRKPEDIIQDGMKSRWKAVADGPTAPIQSRISIEDMSRVKELAETEGITVSEWVRNLILRELESVEAARSNT